MRPNARPGWSALGARGGAELALLALLALLVAAPGCNLIEIALGRHAQIQCAERVLHLDRVDVLVAAHQHGHGLLALGVHRLEQHGLHHAARGKLAVLDQRLDGRDAGRAVLVHRDRLAAGLSFKLFLLGYGLFRFGLEFVRGNPDMTFGLSGSQIFLLLTIPLLIVHVARLSYQERRIAMSGAHA